MTSDEARARAAAIFKKDEQARDAAKARQDYEEAMRATREKTARLRALRLAKEPATKPASAAHRASEPAAAPASTGSLPHKAGTASR